MQMTPSSLWLLLACILMLWTVGCSGTEPEPIYDGKPLHEWAEWTQDQDPDFSPSADAQRAANAVRAIGPAKAIPFLIRWIQPPWRNSMTPGGAVECFHIFGPDAKAAIPDLAKILSRPAKTMNDESAQTMASQSLSYLGADAVPILLQAATNFHGQHIQWEIIKDMANFGTNGAPAKPAILNWSHDPDEWVRLGALHAYVAIEDDQAAKTQFLLNAMNDANELVRRDAAEYFGVVSQGQGKALPALLKALDDPDWQVRTGAIIGLGKSGADKKVVLPLLAQQLHGPNRIIRRCAALALGDVGGKEAFDALMQSTADPDESAREAVFQSLKKIDPDALAHSGKKFY
jgi:HEAT repeat protein